MATVTMVAMGKGAFMAPQIQRQTLDDRPDLREIVEDIVALRAMAKDGTVLTHKSQRDLVSKLNPHELAIVARAVAKAESTKNL